VKNVKTLLARLGDALVADAAITKETN